MRKLKKRILFSVVVYCLSAFFYVMLWRAVVNVPFLPLTSNVSSSSPDTNQQLNIEASVDVKIWRYDFLPVYWSRMGDLTVYHLTYFAASTATLFLVVAVSYFKSESHKHHPEKVSIELRWE